jgi:hypothetical protein
MNKNQTRKMVDCRTMPSDKNCSLTISGSEEEVFKAAREHAISSHGHKPSPELDRALRASMQDEKR